jgi:hypothetical protein
MRIKKLGSISSYTSKSKTIDVNIETPRNEEEIPPIHANEIYEDRIVAFIDILGFRSIVQKSSKHHNSERYHIPQYREEGLDKAIFEVLDTKQYAWEAAFYNELKLEAKSAPQLNLKITSFSDCIALSCPPNEVDFCYLVFCINFIARHMHQNGFMLRGGICEGELHHSETEVDNQNKKIAGRIFGPAFIQAYDLECKKATHSRIILSNMLWKRVKDDWIDNSECGYCSYIKPFIGQDEDGPVKLDTLMSYYKHISTQDIESISSELIAIKTETEKVLSFYTEDARVYSKLRRFSKEFNDMLDELSANKVIKDPSVLEPYRISLKMNSKTRYKHI